MKREELISLLEYQDDALASRAWYDISSSGDRDLLSMAAAHVGKLLAILSSNSLQSRCYAWASAARLLEAGLISPDPLRQLKGFLLELLVKAPSTGLKVMAWSTVPALLQRGVLSKDDVRPFSDAAWKTLDLASGDDKALMRSTVDRLLQLDAISRRSPFSSVRVLDSDTVIL